MVHVRTCVYECAEWARVPVHAQRTKRGTRVKRNRERARQDKEKRHTHRLHGNHQRAHILEQDRRWMQTGMRVYATSAPRS